MAGYQAGVGLNSGHILLLCALHPVDDRSLLGDVQLVRVRVLAVLHAQALEALVGGLRLDGDRLANEILDLVVGPKGSPDFAGGVLQNGSNYAPGSKLAFAGLGWERGLNLYRHLSDDGAVCEVCEICDFSNFHVFVLVSSAGGQRRLSPQQPPLVGRQLSIRRDFKKSLALFCGSLFLSCFLLHRVGYGLSLLGWLTVGDLGLDVLDKRLLCR